MLPAEFNALFELLYGPDVGHADMTLEMIEELVLHAITDAIASGAISGTPYEQSVEAWHLATSVAQEAHFALTDAGCTPEADEDSFTLYYDLSIVFYQFWYPGFPHSDPHNQVTLPPDTLLGQMI